MVYSSDRLFFTGLILDVFKINGRPYEQQVLSREKLKEHGREILSLAPGMFLASVVFCLTPALFTLSVGLMGLYRWGKIRFWDKTSASAKTPGQPQQDKLENFIRNTISEYTNGKPPKLLFRPSDPSDKDVQGRAQARSITFYTHALNGIIKSSGITGKEKDNFLRCVCKHELTHQRSGHGLMEDIAAIINGAALTASALATGSGLMTTTAGFILAPVIYLANKFSNIGSAQEHLADIGAAESEGLFNTIAYKLVACGFTSSTLEDWNKLNGMNNAEKLRVLANVRTALAKTPLFNKSIYGNGYYPSQNKQTYYLIELYEKAIRLEMKAAQTPGKSALPAAAPI